MNTTCSTGQPPIVGWFCEGTFPTLFTDSVTVAQRWMELGSTVIALVRQADMSAAAPAAGDALDAGNEALGAAIIRAGRDLPENFEISLHLELGYGGATLTYPDGGSVDLDSEDERNLASEINEGIDHAIAQQSQRKEA